MITRLAGGAGLNTLLSAEGMDPERYEVWIAAGRSGGLWGRAERSGIRTVRMRRFRERIAPLQDLAVLFELFRLIRRHRFSVVHTHTAKGGFLGRIAAWLAGTPVVVHTFHAFAAHPFMGSGRRRLYVVLDRLVRGMADRYLAVSPSVARHAVEMRFAPPGSVVVIPSAVEVDLIPDEPDRSVRRELGIREGSPIVGWVGRMVQQKAPVDFVRMAALVHRSHPDAIFVMVGDAAFESSPLEGPTRDEAARLGVDVVFTGFRSDAPRLTSAFDVFVVSSLYEGLGRGLTEAMASGRPVVATAVNGVPDLVEQGSTGLLAAPGDPAGLAECVRWMLDHPEEARGMGVQAKARVSRGFEPNAMCSALDSAYGELLGIPPAAPWDPGRPLVVLPQDEDDLVGAGRQEGLGAGRART